MQCKCDFFFLFWLYCWLRIFSKENYLKGGLFKIPANWELCVRIDSSASKAYYVCKDRVSASNDTQHKEKSSYG